MTGFKLNEPTNTFCNPYGNLDLWYVINVHQNQKSLILLSTKSLISKLNMMWGNVHFSFENHGSTTEQSCLLMLALKTMSVSQYNVVLFMNVIFGTVLSALTGPSLFFIKLNEIMHRLFSRNIRFVIVVRAQIRPVKLNTIIVTLSERECINTIQSNGNREDKVTKNRFLWLLSSE